MNSRKKAVLAVSAAALLLIALACGLFMKTHVFVDGKAYPADASALDLRGTELSLETFETLHQALPGCTITWDIPFQGSFLPEDTSEVTVTSLTREDITALAYLPALQTVNANGCQDYSQLMALQDSFPDVQVLYSVNIDGKDYSQDAPQLTISAISDDEISLLRYLPALSCVDAYGCRDLAQLKKLQAEYPQLTVSYSVPLAGENYDRFTTELTLTDADTAELTQMLSHMPKLKTITLEEPAGSAESLLCLVETYPGIHFSWNKDVFGVAVTSEDTEIDLSGTAPESLEQVEAALAYFPNAEKLILCDCGFDNEAMAAFREKMRSAYKVVWNVEVGYLTLRTDDIYYMPGKYDLGVTEEQAYNLRYCEDMICIDVGHKPLFTCEWAAFMPNLKYLIIADTMISDISPLEGLDQLIYLEMFITKVTDLSPLLTCTALEDLNLCYTHADPEPVTQMTWLKNLWWAEPPMEEAEFQKYLPDTHLMFLHHSSTGNGWRQLQNYYDMRDILGMHYMWG